MKTQTSPVQRLARTMKRMNYSPQTIKAYTARFREFDREIGKHPNRINKIEIEEYLNNKDLGVSAQNIFINAIKCYYEKVLGQNRKLYKLKRPRNNKSLPVVIDHNRIVRSLKHISDLRARTMLTLCYSTGVRVSELVRIKVKDIDSDRMLIRIYNGKGRKTRYVKLSETVLSLLRRYYHKYSPDNFLFEGKNGGHLSPSTAGKYYKRYIDADSSIHTLRHSCFTHMIESGTDLSIVQKLAGHNSIQTTRKYIHLSQQSLQLASTPV